MDVTVLGSVQLVTGSTRCFGSGAPSLIGVKV